MTIICIKPFTCNNTIFSVSFLNEILFLHVFFKAVANATVPVTADINIKVPVNLTLQPRRHTDTFIFISIHLRYVMIHLLCRKLKKIITFENFFQIWHSFIFYRYCNYKEIWWRYTGGAFLEFKAPVFKTVLKLQTNLLTVYWQHIFQDSKYRYLNHKQIRWQHTGNAFLGLQHRYFWQNDTFTFFWKWRWRQIRIKLVL